MSERQAPAEFVALLAGEHWPRFWAGCDARGAGADVLARLQAATDAWRLSGVEVMSGGVVSLVCAATRPDAVPVVVKVSPRVPGSHRLAAEGAALAFWQPTGGAVAVIDERDDGYTLLLERVTPGDSLEDADLALEDMLRVCGTLAGRVHAAGPAPDAFERLRVADRMPNWLSLLAGEPELQAELRQLLRDRGDDVLIHGDLHARNILRHADGWKIIDPQALRADRHAEVRPLLEAALALTGDEAANRVSVDAWLHAFGSAAGMDAHRLRRFTLLRALSEARGVDRMRDANAQWVRWATGLHRLAIALR